MTDERPVPGIDHRRTLEAAVEGLYSTFASYKLHGPVVGCPHCTSLADDERLRSRPLRDLHAGDLQRFAFKAMSTLGTVEDFKHFLPRMLEIAAQEGEVGDTDFEVLMGKLHDAEWSTWPSPERAAVERFLTALWWGVLGTYPAPADIDTYLCGLGRAGDDLSPFLDHWERDTSVAALGHLAEFVTENAPAWAKHQRLRSAFWTGRDDQVRQVLDWLARPALQAHLEEGFFRHADEPVAGELSIALGYLEWGQQAARTAQERRR